MSTVIGGLLMPKFETFDYGRVVNQGINAAGGMLSNETRLLELADLKRQQEAQAQARALYQQDPSILFGGTTLGSLQQAPAGGPPGPMTQQPFGPGGVTGPPQQIPAPMAPNANLGGPPGGMPQSTIASLAPQQPPQQGFQERLMALARTNPDAARLVQQQMQGQQQYQFKLEEQRLDWTSKKMAYFGQVLQGGNSPESYADARLEIGRVDPQAAARLPPSYSKEALQPYIKQALSVKDSATLQLETMKVQAQMAQLGLQGMTPSVVTQLKADGKDPRTATSGDITQALEKIRASEVEQKEKEGLAAAQARTEGEKQARLDKTVSEAFGERTTKLYDTQTGGTVDSRMKVKDYEAMPAGRVKELSTNQTEQMENVNTSIPVIAQLQTHIDKSYGPGGVLARMTPDERADLTAAPERWAKQYAQKYPELQQAQRFIDSNAGQLARALAGEKGAMAEGDVERAKAMLPNLETSLKLWPPSKLAIQTPDTRAVALRSMNSVVDLVNGRVRTLLGNDQFTHPKLHRYEIAEEQQAPSGTGTPAPVQPPAATPERPWWNPYLIPPATPKPPTQLNPNLPPVPGQPTPAPAPQPPAASVPAPGTPIFPPAPAIRIPGETAARATPTQPPTATSTPAQDEAYRQSVAPSPAPRPTPGRQSQATGGARAVRLAQLPGAPKVMELADVAEAMRQTGRSRREVEAAARAKGYTVYGSKLKLPEETAIG